MRSIPSHTTGRRFTLVNLPQNVERNLGKAVFITNGFLDETVLRKLILKEIKSSPGGNSLLSGKKLKLTKTNKTDTKLEYDLKLAPPTPLAGK